ncbi:MAG TPA: hypothetical protein VJR30_15035 [Bradyrhizobium sp.]|nr:hypothetical protein [Bradyrhizobium sp.]
MKRLVLRKAAVFAGYRRRLGRKIACLPRRYVAGKIFEGVASGLWTATAAVQRLAF